MNTTTAQTIAIAATAGITMGVTAHLLASFFHNNNKNDSPQHQPPQQHHVSIVAPPCDVSQTRRHSSTSFSCTEDAAAAASHHRHVTTSPPDNFIARIAITGGPCAGKSTAMDTIRKEFESRGFKVFVVPEMATILINGGLDFGQMAKTKNGIKETQKMLLKNILQIEDAFYKLACFSEKPSIVLCDRGTMDGRAYCTDDEWSQILQETGYSLDELRDVRYDAVIHLVTAAIGAEKFYTTANNSARSESVEQAAALDEKTKMKYLGHRLIHVVDNSSTFQNKIDRVVKFVENLVDKEQVDTIHHDTTKNLTIYPIAVDGGKATSTVDLPKDKVSASHMVEVSIHPLFARPKYMSEQLIRRSTADSDIFYLRAKLKNGSRSYVEISAREYSQILAEREDTAIGTVSKRHLNFFCGLHYWTVTTWLKGPEDAEGKTFLIGQAGVDAKAALPFLNLGQAVVRMTKEKMMNNSSMSCSSLL